MGRIRLIAVGAVSIDTILTVPHYPLEDSKLRATNFIRRRGGNSPNSLEVLFQLLQQNGVSDVDLALIAPLPARTSQDNELISKSLGHVDAENEASISDSQTLRVDLNQCLYREDCDEAVSSYIIASESTNSRTIVNHNAVSEMTFDEFISQTEAIIGSSTDDPGGAEDDKLWFHFEGRIPETTHKCIKYLRKHLRIRDVRLKISVELEKPLREGLQALALEADVVFYSRSWAEGEEYSSAEMCLREQARIIQDNTMDLAVDHVGEQLLICTWGSSGASAVNWKSSSSSADSTEESEAFPDVHHSPAYISPGEPIVDTTGAGDTFIAAILFALICKSTFAQFTDVWTIKRMLDFANDLAGRKILQYGFQMNEISFDPR